MNVTMTPSCFRLISVILQIGTLTVRYITFLTQDFSLNLLKADSIIAQNTNNNKMMVNLSLPSYSNYDNYTFYFYVVTLCIVRFVYCEYRSADFSVAIHVMQLFLTCE